MINYFKLQKSKMRSFQTGGSLLPDEEDPEDIMEVALNGLSEDDKTKWLNFSKAAELFAGANTKEAFNTAREQAFGQNGLVEDEKLKKSLFNNFGDKTFDNPPTLGTTAQTYKAADFEPAKKASALDNVTQYGNVIANGMLSLDNALMGDKNFGALSLAIDATVHTASNALINSGNPYAAAAGVALEGANFLTKMTGDTVEGFDVDIKNSGYSSELSHQESKSHRDFLSIIGLGGLNGGSILRLLEERNEKAAMALKAANISDTIAYEQEARMNSVDDVLRQNKIALNGGIDTSILAAKNGSKLKKIELEEDKNILPTGAMHKNKNNLDIENITEKGIPVLQVDKDVDTLEINTAEDIKNIDYKQSAEIEAAELIFSGALTEIVEKARKEWNESKDNKICLEIGKKLCKELLFNNIDEDDITEQMEERVNAENKN